MSSYCFNNNKTLFGHTENLNNLCFTPLTQFLRSYQLKYPRIPALMLKHFFPTLSSWMQEPTYYSSPRGYYLRVCGLPTWKSQVHFLRQVIEVRIQDRSKACPPYVIRDSKNLSMTAENFSKKKKGNKNCSFSIKVID